MSANDQNTSDEIITRENFQRTTHPDAQWFGEAGLGLFIHWGISSAHGSIDLSWGMMDDKPWSWDSNKEDVVTPEEYYKLAERFKPDKYAPEKWLKAAKEAGFRYAVMTTRHHDGYAMWPSNYGELGVKKYLPGVDFVDGYAKACRNSGLKLGFYYSPPDWYYNRHYMSFHYGSTNQDRFPGRKHYNMRHEVMDTIPARPAGFDADYKAYIHGQVVELLTRYGKIDVLWFDGGPEAINFSEIRKLQPGIVVNPRMHGYGDFRTPECEMPNAKLDDWWELCDIWPHGGWGYDKRHENYSSTGWMLSRLTKVRGWGGNYLINAGPRPTGEMPDVYYQRLRELAEWMKYGGESIFGVRPGPHPEKSNVPVTVRDDRWYLHVSPDFKDAVVLTGINKPKSVKLLKIGAGIVCKFADGHLTINIPPDSRTELVDVVVVDW